MIINIKDITKSLNTNNKLLHPGDFNACIELSEPNIDTKDIKVNILVHDAYKIHLVKVYPNNDVLVSIGNGSVKKYTMFELFNRCVRVYNAYISNDIYSFTKVLDDMPNPANKENMILYMPDSIFEVYEALGINRATFVNTLLYPLVRKLVNLYNDVDALRELRDAAMRIMINSYLDSTLHTERYMPTPLYMVTDQVVSALILDSIAKEISTSDNYTSNIEAIKTAIITSDIFDKAGRLLTEAVAVYNSKGDSSLFKTKLIKWIRSNILDLGLASAIVYNDIAVNVNTYGMGKIDNKETISNFNSFYESYMKNNMINLRKAFAEDIPASQAFDVNTLNIPQVYEIETPLEPTVIDNTLETTPVTPTISTIETDSLASLHNLKIESYINKFNLYKEAKVFETPEDKKAMVDKLINLIDDIDRARAAFNYPTEELSYAPNRSSLGMYDVLSQNIKDHIDYLNSMRYFGDSDELVELNLNNYITNTKAESYTRNFNILSIPIEYFPGVDTGIGRYKNAKGEAIGTISVDDDLENYDEAKANKIKTRRNDVITRRVFSNDFTRYAHSIPVLAPAFRIATRNIKRFFGGLKRLLLSILNVLIPIEESNGIDYTPYQGSVILYNDLYITKEQAKELISKEEKYIYVYREEEEYNGALPVPEAKGELFSEILTGAKYYAGASMVKSIAKGIKRRHLKKKIARENRNAQRELYNFHKMVNDGDDDMHFKPKKYKDFDDDDDDDVLDEGFSESKVKTVSNPTLTRKIKMLNIFIPIISIFNKTINREEIRLAKEDVERIKADKTFISNSNKECLEMVDKILKNDNLDNESKHTLSRLKKALSGVKETKKEAISEALNIKGVNQLKVDKLTKITTVKDITDLATRLKNTVEYELEKVVISNISFQKGTTAFIAIVTTNKGKILFYLNNSYIPFNDALVANIKPLVVNNKVIPILAYDMDSMSVDAMVNSKSINKAKSKIEVTSADVQEVMAAKTNDEIRHSVVKDFEDKVLKDIKKNILKEQQK